MLQSFIAWGVISLHWVFFSFSLAFGDTVNSWGIFVNPFQYAFLNNLDSNNSNITYLLFALFQLKFAIITPAIITRSFAERIRFRSYLLFMILFCVLIYTPLAHMTWVGDGLFANLGDVIGKYELLSRGCRQRDKHDLGCANYYLEVRILSVQLHSEVYTISLFYFSTIFR